MAQTSLQLYQVVIIIIVVVVVVVVNINIIVIEVIYAYDVCHIYELQINFYSLSAVHICDKIDMICTPSLLILLV